MTLFRPPRGTRDYLPEDMNIRKQVISTFARVFELYGYGEVLTPAFEHLELLEAKAGPEVKEQIYWFKDKAGRRLGLRFELTTPIARIVASHPEFPKPIRFYYIAPVWRYEEPQKGRLREFWHAGIELIGSSKIYADAEVIAVAYRAVTKVGLRDIIVKINDRAIIEALAEKIGVKQPYDEYFRILDKLDKQGVEGVSKLLREYGLNEKAIKQTLDLITLTGENEEKIKVCREILGSKVEKSLNKLKELLDLLTNSYSIPEKAIEINFSIVRGLAYYTSLVFEVIVPGLDLGSLAGGGRYDDLIKLVGGPPLPATGMAIGVERVIEALKLKNLIDKPEYINKVIVIPVSSDTYRESVRIAEMLRDNGISTEIDVMGRKMVALLEYADKMKLKYAVIVGRKELENGEVVVKDLRKREQVNVKIEKLVDYLKSTLYE